MEFKPDELIVIQNGCQPYEPMAIPPYSKILGRLNLKESMRQAEYVLNSTIDMAVLLITTGSDKNTLAQNQMLVNATTTLLSQKSIGRVLVMDHTSKAEFAIPDLAKLFSKEKYESLDAEINAGLNDIFSMEANFSQSYTKTKIYLELLNQARDAFLNMFLLPEMARIAKTLGFNIDGITVEFEEVMLESEVERLKIFSHLYEVGNLTAEGLEDAFRTLKLPLNEISIEQQKTWKALRDKELYEPLIGGAKPDSETGRPVGAKKKQTKVAPKRPAGSSASVDENQENFASLTLIKENLIKIDNLFSKVEESYKKKNGLSRLGKNHKKICENISSNVVISESIDKWDDSFNNYIDNPLQINNTVQREEVLEIMAEHDIPMLSAAIFYHGKTKE